MNSDDASAARTSGFWLPVLTTTGMSVAVLYWFVSANPRLLVAWHGFLHTAIALRFPSATFTPENPFFAGQPLTYYWFYQWLAAGVSRLSGMDMIHAFQAIALTSLAVLIISGGLIGRSLYRSPLAGVLIAYLAVVGLNPLGPAIAEAKHIIKGQALLEHPRLQRDGDVFVSNDDADDRMAKPLLPALHIGMDWQRGQNLVWFFDVSSRAPSLALLVTLAFLLTHPRQSHAVTAGLVVTGALVTALNPIVGLSVSGALVASACYVWKIRQPRSDDPQPANREMTRSIAFSAGALLAAPTYVSMLLVGHSARLTFAEAPLKIAAIAAAFMVLLPLAWLGLRRAPARAIRGLTVIALTGTILTLAVPIIGLYEVNEHNFANAGACLLAVPAAAWIFSGRHGRALDRRGIRAACLVALFVPITAATLVAFANRPPLPLRFDGRTLRRTPLDDPLDAFYQWIRSATATNAVFIVNPSEPVKMSGNVSELPAFTGRTLFVDQLTYLIESYPDQPFRTALAVDVTSGATLGRRQLEYLRALGRPLYVVIYHADRDDTMTKLSHEFGQPTFRNAYVAAFLLSPDRMPTDPAR